MMTSREACRQLALCQLLAEHLKLPANSVRGYDPIWTVEDCTLFKNCGFGCIEQNERGYCSLADCTLVYMPHCPKGLYENVLAANWHPDRFTHLILLELPHAEQACNLLVMRYIQLKRTRQDSNDYTSDMLEEDKRQFDDNHRAFSELCLQWPDPQRLSDKEQKIDWNLSVNAIDDPELIN
ncbi:hypothetical protein BDF19DRAFT_434710 [Syncephalis fuscata]|nr:hypothetical protein BDF19DRAFT_434710 [Syncephalis fuscata]